VDRGGKGVGCPRNNRALPRKHHHSPDVHRFPQTARQDNYPPAHHKQSGLREKSALAHMHTMNAIAPATSLLVHRVICCVEPCPRPGRYIRGPAQTYATPRRSSTGDSDGGSSCIDRHDRFRFCIIYLIVYTIYFSFDHSLSLVLCVSLYLRFSVRTHNNLFSCIGITFGGRGGEGGSSRRTHTNRSFSRQSLSVRPAAQHMCTTPTTLRCAQNTLIIIYYNILYYVLLLRQ